MSIALPAAVPHAPMATASKSSSRGFWLLIGLLSLVGVGKAITADTMDPDAFWHLRVADQLCTDGIGPLVDRISFASLKTPWTPYSWLAELFMRAVWNVGGFRAATLVTAACSGAIILLIGATAREASRWEGQGASDDVTAALLTAVAAFFTLPFISFRPVTFGLVVMAAIIWLLVRDRRRTTAWVWAVVPLTVLLTNLHLYAAIIPLVVWASRPRFQHARGRDAHTTATRPLLQRGLIAVCVSLAALCTPMLHGAIATALSYNGTDPMVAAPFITEMRPFYAGGTGKVSLGLFILMLAVCVVRRRRLNLTDWLWFAIGTVLLFRLGRFSPVFAMLATPAVARAMPRLGGRALGKPAVQVALAVVLVAGVVNLLPALGERDFDHWLNRNTPAYPTAAAAFVEAHVPPRRGRLVNEFNWGGYLAWRLGDRYQVLMDGRTQLYAPQFWRSTHLGTFETRTALLKTVRADAAIVPAHDSALLPSLEALGWTQAYRDDLAIVMVPAS